MTEYNPTIYEVDAERFISFSDFHWGKNKDAEVKLKHNDSYIDWLIGECNSQSIDTLVFLGDWFESRNNVSVKTYNHSYKALKRISAAGIKIYMFVGNHDAYFKNTIEVNSLSPLNHIPGVHIIDRYSILKFTNGSSIGLFPWEEFNEEHLDQYKKESFGCIMGHFEFVGASFSNFTGHVCKSGQKSGDLIEASPLVFSGHFHIRKEYVYKNGKIVCIGCPLELDWGDYQDVKGYYIVNSADMSYEFYENTHSPKHLKLYWSRIKRKVEENIKNIEGNYIKLVVDEEYDFNQISNLIQKINAKNPLRPCQPNFIVNTDVHLITNSDFDKSGLLNVNSKFDYIQQYINSLEEAQFDTNKVEKDVLLDKLKYVYTYTIEKLKHDQELKEDSE